MATSRTSDVNLIVRAKTEGEATVKALGDVLERVFRGARDGSSDMAGLGRDLAALDKGFAQITGKADAASAAFDRQSRALEKSKQELRDAGKIAADYTKNIEAMQRRIVDTKLGGGDTVAMVVQLRTLQAEQAKLGDRTVQLRRTIDSLENGVTSSRSSLLNLGSTVNAIGEAQTTARGRIDATTAAMERQARAAQTLSNIRGSQYRDSGKSAELSAGAFIAAGQTSFERQSAADAARAASDAKGLVAALDPLAALQEKYNVQIARARELKDADRISSTQLAATEARLAAELEKGKKSLAEGAVVGKLGLFGLKPYEVQNLSYQINDVVTGLASGQHASQVLTQQGGQIIQLFPKVGGAVLGALSNPGILAGVATIVALSVAIKAAADNAERLRSYSAQLNFRADGSSYNAQALADEQKQLQRLGASADDAKAALTTFLDRGIAPDKLSTFGRLASEAAETLGIKLPEAATLLAEAFSGGYAAVAKLDDKLNFLTADQRQHIRTLFESGQAQAAQTEALGIYTHKQDELAQKSRGEWSDSVRLLTTSVHELFDALGNTAFAQHLLQFFADLSKHFSELARDVDRIMNAAKINDAAKTVNASADEVAAAEKSGDPKRIAAARRANADAARRLLALQGNPQDAATGSPTTGSTNSLQSKQDADAIHRIDLEEELQHLRDTGQQRLLSAQEQARREFLAGEQAARSATDAAVAAAERRRAVAHETATIEKESDARAKQAAGDREREIRQFTGRVIGAEGGAGKNPFSSAAGYGQFTESTWLAMAKKVLPDQTAGMGRDQILALRQNEGVARGVIDAYARENAHFLESFGAKVTAGNLYLAHFLGAGGAKAVLTAGSDVPVNQIIRSPAALSGNAAYLRTDGGKGRYRTAGELQTFMAARMGDTGQPQTEAQAAINTLIQEATNRQNNFNEAVRHGVEDRQDALRTLQQEVGLHGTALILAQRQKAVTDAERELRQKAEDANKNLKPGETAVVVSPAQVQQARDVAAALFDAQHAAEVLQAKLGDNQRVVDGLEEQKKLLQAQAEFLRSIGENSAADQIDKQIQALTPKLKEAYDQLIAFYKALSPEQRVQLGIVDEKALDNVVGKLQQGKQQSQEWGKIAGIPAQQIAQSFQSAASSAMTNFLNKLEQGKNFFKSLGEGVREFAASFIQSIAQMILQLLAYAAAVQILRALGVPVPASASAGVLHSGGIVGQGGGQSRYVDPAWFAGATRYHTGGIAGFAPDERPAILKAGEEVLTASDPRHRFNGGGASGGTSGGGTTVIPVLDYAEGMRQALQRPAGEKVILQHITDNAGSIRTALGV